MSDDDAKRVLADVDALVARGRQRDRMNAARLKAIDEGRDPELAATAASVDVRPPLQLAGRTPGLAADGHQHPTIRARVGRIRTAIQAGRLTPAEGTKVLAAMGADEIAATKLLDDLPAGRVPLGPRAHVPDPENPIGPGPLPGNVSLLNPSERAEIAARRRRDGAA